MGCGWSKLPRLGAKNEIRLLPFTVLKGKGKWPVFPPDYEDTCEVPQDIHECLVVYIQYEPETMVKHGAELYQLAIVAIEKMREQFTSEKAWREIYLFMDLSCQFDDLAYYKNLDLGKQKDSGGATSTLYEIMQLCDCMLSLLLLAPLAGNSSEPTHSPNSTSDPSFNTPQKAPRNRALPLQSPISPSLAFGGEETKSSSTPTSHISDLKFYGHPHSYLAEGKWHTWLGHAWTRVELLFCSQVLTMFPEKFAIFKGPLYAAAKLGRRLHVVYAASVRSTAASISSNSARAKSRTRSRSKSHIAQFEVQGESAALLVLPYFRSEYKKQLTPTTAMNHRSASSEGINNKIVYLLRLLSSRPTYTLSVGSTENSVQGGGGVIKQVLPSGAVFEGQINGDRKYSGSGTYVSSSYDTFSGTWAAGSLDGEQCTIQYNNGDVYNGGVLRNKRNGYGTMTYADGSYYNGGWKNGVKEGDAKSFDAESSNLYCGSFLSGLPHGFGQYTYKNGSVFIGSFENGQRHGKGKLIRKKRVRDPNAPPAEVGLSSGFIEKDDEFEVHEGSWYLDKLQM